MICIFCPLAFSNIKLQTHLVKTFQLFYLLELEFYFIFFFCYLAGENLLVGLYYEPKKNVVMKHA